MPRNDQPDGTNKGIGPEGCRCLEFNAYSVIIHLHDIHIAIGTGSHGRNLRIARIFPVEHHVIGGEILAIMPFHAALQFPGDGTAILRKAAIFDRGDFGRQDRLQGAIGGPAGKRLVEDAAGILIGGAGGEMGVEQRGGLPIQNLQMPATAAARAAIGRDACRRGLRIGCPGHGEKLRRHGRGKANRRHAPDKGAARHGTILHTADKAAQIVFLHEFASRAKR